MTSSMIDSDDCRANSDLQSAKTHEFGYNFS